MFFPGSSLVKLLLLLYTVDNALTAEPTGRTSASNSAAKVVRVFKRTGSVDSLRSSPSTSLAGFWSPATASLLAQHPHLPSSPSPHPTAMSSSSSMSNLDTTSTAAMMTPQETRAQGIHVTGADLKPEAGHHNHGHHGYFQYARVPHKGAWEFGFRRGNHGHFKERHEHGKGPHFKTKVRWGDKHGGYGEHFWDYNHHGHDHGHHQKHHAAAAGAAASS